jgi:hypothetical protein
MFRSLPHIVLVMKIFLKINSSTVIGTQYVNAHRCHGHGHGHYHGGYASSMSSGGGGSGVWHDDTAHLSIGSTINYIHERYSLEKTSRKYKGRKTSR